MTNELPPGWAKTELREVVLLRKGKKPKSLYSEPLEDAVPYILIDEMEGKPPRFFTNDKTVPIARPEDVLIVWDGSIGKTVTGMTGAIGSTIAALSPIVIQSQFLEYYLKTAKPYIEQTSRGTGLQHINPTTFWPMLFPLPPLNEQKRIAAKLDQIMPRIQAVKNRLEKIPLLLKRFRQAVLSAAVTGKLTEKWRVSNEELLTENKRPTKTDDKSQTHKSVEPIFESVWEFELLDSFFKKGDIFDGPFGSNLKTSDYTNDGVAVIRLENIGFLSFDKNKRVFISVEKYEMLKRHTVYEGDVIFSSFISENIRAVVLPKLENTYIAKADCFCLRLSSEKLDNQYLVYCLSSQQIHDYLKMQVHGATRPRINTTQLRNTPIPIPPLQEQKIIVQQIERLFGIADKLEARYKSAKAKVDKLAQATLAKAFRGELVIPEAELAHLENRTYETAEQLLERITEEKRNLPRNTRTIRKNKT